MPYEFNYDEWMRFTKTERRIISLIRTHGYAKEEVQQSLEIKGSTFRTHWANIQRKLSDIRRERNMSDMRRMYDEAKEKGEILPVEPPPKKVAQTPEGLHPIEDEVEQLLSEETQTETPVLEKQIPFTEHHADDAQNHEGGLQEYPASA